MCVAVPVRTSSRFLARTYELVPLTPPETSSGHCVGKGAVSIQNTAALKSQEAPRYMLVDVSGIPMVSRCHFLGLFRELSRRS
jgi:hypothetical protein